jgi:ribosome-binding factor A
MKIDRLTRVNELLRREIGEGLYRMIDRSTFDIAAITVTHVITSNDLRTARVLVSIRGHEEDRERMLERLQHLHGALQHEIAQHVILKYTPKLQFVLDESIEGGDRILSLLSKLPTAPDEEVPPTHEP